MVFMKLKKMKKQSTYLFVFILFVLNLVGCVSKKDIVYFQYDSIDTKNISNDYQLHFKPDDMLQITISAENLESVLPFNLPVIAYQNINGNVLGQPQLQAYLVDRNGYIEFPVLGSLKVGGLTRLEVIHLLKDKLDPAYVRNPIINIFITNFKVTVQGDVMRPGSFPIVNERLSIFDALGLAGDLNISGNRENVLVIREENNSKNEYRVNLMSKKILTSPVYYLQQNDIVYVEPNNAKSQDAAYTRSTGLFISLASVLISLVTVITR